MSANQGQSQKVGKSAKTNSLSAPSAFSAVKTVSTPAPPPPDFTFTPIVVPRGDGSFVVSPGKPRVEVGTIAAAKMLGVGRATMAALREDPRAMKILRCRFTTPSCKILRWDVASLHAFKVAMEQLPT